MSEHMAVSEELAEGHGLGNLMSAVEIHEVLGLMSVSTYERNICQLTGG